MKVLTIQFVTQGKTFIADGEAVELNTVEKVKMAIAAILDNDNFEHCMYNLGLIPLLDDEDTTCGYISIEEMHEADVHWLTYAKETDAVATVID